jgi:hypothetical protein
MLVCWQMRFWLSTNPKYGSTSPGHEFVHNDGIADRPRPRKYHSKAKVMISSCGVVRVGVAAAPARALACGSSTPRAPMSGRTRTPMRRRGSGDVSVTIALVAGVAVAAGLAPVATSVGSWSGDALGEVVPAALGDEVATVPPCNGEKQQIISVSRCHKSKTSCSKHHKSQNVFSKHHKPRSC